MTRAHRRRLLSTALAASIAFSPAANGGPAFATTESASPTTWTAMPRPHGGELRAVSCVSATRCYAVGRTKQSPSQRALVEQWDGARWTVMPNQPAGTSSVFDGISCTSPTDCVAVGAFVIAPLLHPFSLIERWNGHRWSIEPNTGMLATELLAVSCESTARCVAIGASRDDEIAMAALWDGHRWSPTALPALPFGLRGTLSGVSCTSSTHCVAVGSAAYPGAATETLVENWDGARWSIVDTPTRGSTHHRTLLSVSCVSDASCFAVGRSGDDPIASSTLIERWDGTRWTVLHSPTTGGPYRAAVLSGLSCVSATSCVAVGSARRTDVLQELVLHELVERWNGTEWSVVPVHRPGATQFNSLDAVSCTPEHCAAVGFTFTNGFDSSTLALSGNVTPRTVKVSWTAPADQRLREIAAYLHVSPPEAQKVAVYITAYLIGLGPRVQSPASVARTRSGATYSTVWSQSELGVLDSVRAKFAVGSVGATRVSVNLVSFLLALSGH
jgi:hypothetical protein